MAFVSRMCLTTLASVPSSRGVESSQSIDVRNVAGGSPAFGVPSTQLHAAIFRTTMSARSRMVISGGRCRRSSSRPSVDQVFNKITPISDS